MQSANREANVVSNGRRIKRLTYKLINGSDLIISILKRPPFMAHINEVIKRLFGVYSRRLHLYSWLKVKARHERNALKRTLLSRLFSSRRSLFSNVALRCGVAMHPNGVLYSAPHPGTACLSRDLKSRLRAFFFHPRVNKCLLRRWEWRHHSDRGGHHQTHLAMIGFPEQKRGVTE